MYRESSGTEDYCLKCDGPRGALARNPDAGDIGDVGDLPED